MKILDFGLARLGDSDITRTGTVMGTPNYMSPEQIKGQKVDARSDVFSLGAVFYELLCHHRPFEADSDHDVRFQIVEQSPEPIRRWAPEVPPALVAVVERALAKDLARRFADAGEMGRALATARDAIEGDTLAGPATRDADRTILQGADATVVQPPAPGPAYGTVRGATALTLARAPAAAGQSHLPRTVRPDPTVAGGAATRAPAGAGPSRALVLGGAAALAVAIAVGVVWLRSSARVPGAASSPPDGPGRDHDGRLRHQPGGAGAGRPRRPRLRLRRPARRGGPEAQPGQRGRPRGARPGPARRGARSTTRWRRRGPPSAVGDVAAASEALGRVMILAPRHPVVAELSTALKEHLRPQAEDSRRPAEARPQGRDGGRAGASAGWSRARSSPPRRDALLRRQDYATAAQKYLESRNAFERAKRDADQARAVAALPSPSRHAAGRRGHRRRARPGDALAVRLADQHARSRCRRPPPLPPRRRPPPRSPRPRRASLPRPARRPTGRTPRCGA